MAIRVSSSLLILSLLLLSAIPSSLSYIPSSKRPATTTTTTTKGGGDRTPAPDCREIGSRSECEAKSRWCRWCRSETLDDMCFGSVEAWRLPHQVFSCNPSSNSS